MAESTKAQGMPGVLIRGGMIGGIVILLGLSAWGMYRREFGAVEPVAIDPPPTVIASTSPPPEAAPVAIPAPEPPQIGTWLVAPDGMATIAGRAAPGDLVQVLHNGKVVGEARASGQGEFALVTALPADDGASLMTVVATGADGIARPAVASVAIGPILGPDLASPSGASQSAAPAAPVPVLAVGPEGATLLQGSPPTTDQPALRLETIAYSESGAVQLGGVAARGDTIRIYLDNANVAELSVPESGKWLTTLDDIAPGLYQMRVDQLDAAGQVTARVESPFRRETLEALAAASAIAAPTAPPLPVLSPEPPVAPSLTEENTPVLPTALPLSEPVFTADPAPIAPDQPESAAPLTITVQPGYSLWSIAQGELGSGIRYVQVFEANRDRIRDPNLIYPGQVLTMPQGD